MQLCDRDIRRLIAPRMKDFVEGTSGKGVISFGLTSGGYDFRLGETVKLFTNDHCATVDPLDIDPKCFVPLQIATTCREYEAGKFTRTHRYVTLPGKSYALAETVEWIDVPKDIQVTLIGKSTYARCGVILNCTPLEPGWRGRVTLEIENAGPSPVRLYVGMGIAQAEFKQLTGVPEKDYATRGGKYQDQDGLTLPRA